MNSDVFRVTVTLVTDEGATWYQGTWYCNKYDAYRYLVSDVCTILSDEKNSNRQLQLFFLKEQCCSSMIMS